MEPTRPAVAFLPIHPYAMLLDVLVDRGHDRAAALASAGLDHDAFVRARYLSLAQMEALVVHACTLEPGIGVEVGARLSPTSHGWLGVAASSAATLADALVVVAEYFALVSPLFEASVHVHDDGVVMRIASRWTLPAAVASHHEAVFGASLQTHLARLLFGGMLPSEVEIDAVHRELHVPAALARVALPLADASVHRAALRGCRTQLDARPDPTRTAASVRRVLVASGAPFPDLDGVAKRLATSSRSLRRRLREEGTSFRALLDEVRSTIADEWLDDPKRSITEIGLDLGYTDAANFTRAYRRANGLSPSAARRQRLGLAASA
jgi:AraC-like DNA-binding protein